MQFFHRRGRLGARLLPLLLSVSRAAAEWSYCCAEKQACGCLGTVYMGIWPSSSSNSDNGLDLDAKYVELPFIIGTPAHTVDCIVRNIDPAPRIVKECRCDGEVFPPSPYDNVTGVPLEPDETIFEARRLTLSEPWRSRSRLADAVVPARSSPTFGGQCVAREADAQPADSSEKVVMFYGITLIGEPVERGFEIAQSQLISMYLSGILPDARLNVFITHVRRSPIVTPAAWSGNNRTGASAISELVDLLHEVTDYTARVSVQFENEFEYPALNALWKYATHDASDDELLLYAHNKGVTHATDIWTRPDIGDTDGSPSVGYGPRTLMEMTIFRQIVSAWPHVVGLFRRYGERMQHVSIAPSVTGIGYYNFFWATPAHIRRHEPPLRPGKVPDFERHYYEWWLGNNLPQDASQRGCEIGFSLASCILGDCSGRPPHKAHRRYFAVIRDEIRRHGAVVARDLRLR